MVFLISTQKGIISIFTILSCPNSQPALSGINGTVDSTGATGSFSISVCPNTPVNILIASYDKNVNDVILSSTPQNLTITGFGPMGSTISVNSVPLPDVNIQWTPTAADIGVNTFLINIEDDNCPLKGITTYIYTIYVQEAPDIDAGDVVPICGIGDTVALDAAFVQSTSQTPTYTWTPSTGLSGNFGQTVSAFPNNTTTYQVDVQYGNGCYSSDSVTVLVTNGLDIPALGDTTFCAANPLALDANVQSTPATTFLNDSLKSIIDNDPSGIYSYIDVTGVALPVVTTQGIESVCVNLSQDFAFGASDIDIYLIAPSGTLMELSTDNGGTNAAPYTNTCFTPTATQFISVSSPPFIGNYLPEGNFNTLIGEPTNGLWKLFVLDDAAGFTHKLIDWSITFKNDFLIDYTWTPTASLSCTNCPNPTATPTTTTTYSVYGVNSIGCSDSSEITVLVADTIPAPTITSVNYTTSTMDICWNDHPVASGYEVNIDNTGWIAANGNTCHTISGLTSGQMVHIQIRGLTNCSSSIVLTNQQTITFGSNCLDDGGNLTTTVDATVIQNNIVNFVSYGSTVNFTHSGGNLSGDGDAITASGFDIPIYVGAPATVTGSTAAAINGDAAFSGSFVGTTISGNATIQNNGSYQTTFNSGNPVHLWFAPITLDDHANQLITENAGSTNECTNVNLSAQINMVFLNQLDTFNFQNTVNGDSCTARIRLKGGLPQWDASNYSILIHKVGDTSILATINTPPTTHNGLLEFTVPEQGDYIINITDGNNAYRAFTVSMNLCPIFCTIPFSTNMNINSNYSGLPISCFDAMDGSVSINATGGTPPYSYNWLHDATLNSSTATNIGAGFYQVQIVDAIGCTTIDTISIIPPLPIAGNTISIPDTNDWDVGTLIGNASGGVPPYSYQWDPVLQNVADDTAYNVPQGIYSVTITDANGCTSTEMVSVDSIFNSVKTLDNVNLFQIAPNPTNGIVNVQLELSKAAIVQFDILDIRGQVLRAFNEDYTNQKQMLLDLSNYPSGVYLIRLRVGDSFLVRKLVLMD